MLYKLTLEAGIPLSVTTAGCRHLMIVAAAGELLTQLRSEGQTRVTRLVKGMRLEFPEAFDEMEFESSISQVIQVWADSIPLAYTPAENVAVGAASVSSIHTQVYSGQYNELLPSVPGRYRSYITPSADILIGGPSFAINEGIPIAANERFEIDLQGALYALDTSGNYPGVFTANPTSADIAAATLETAITSKFGYVPSADGSIVLAFDNSSSATKYSTTDYSSLGTVSLGKTPIGYNVFEYQGNAVYTSSTGGQFWVEVDLSDFSVNSESLGVSAQSLEHFAAKGDIRAVYCYSDATVVVSDAGGAWTLGAGASAGVGLPYGCDIDSAGNIYVLFAASLQKTTDNGDTWSTISLPGTAKGENGLAIDELTDTIYIVCTNNTAYQSQDGGATWTAAQVISGMENVYSRGGTVLVAGDSGFSIKTDELGAFVNKARTGAQQRGGGIGSDGTVYVGYVDGFYPVTGEVIGVGGIDVAIMSVVN